ncbi:MAG: fibronectin type III domain-containing protein [Planctomycetes bacterium]|nr:fibronectin type III domain-containing protein [Planctomycetota bacterium]MCB9935021.1 fibronectin type III domain-containing protein [Planctomycetota bacterium]
MRYLLLVLLFAPALAATTYSVGPGQTYTNINDVPLETIGAGDILEIHWRSTPYAEKFVICAQGTSVNPVIVRGIPNGSTGALPVITGANATTRTALSYWGENRGVIKIGGASVPTDTVPQYITIEYLEVRSAHPSYTFTDDGGTGGIAYATNAAAIYVEKGKHIKIQHCVIHDSGNGLFIGPGGGVGNPDLTEDCYVGYNYVHTNGIVSSAFEHNSYCESAGIVYEYNRYGPTRSGAIGNNLKDRSANSVVRYNWIEAGNRQLDLVEADGSGINTLAGYDSTYVYGNTLIEPDGAGNSQIIHYGGDNGTASTYRKGTLYLYNNTIYSTRSGNTTLVRLSTNSETCDCRNNVIFVSASASNLGLIDDTGTLNYRNCFFKGAPTPSHSGGAMQGTVNNLGGIVTGSDPGWTAVGSQDFSLTSTAACRNAGTTLHASTSAHPLSNEYVKHQQQQARPSDGTLDIGAFEYDNGGAPTAPAAPSSCTATAVSGLSIQVSWSDNSGNETGFKLERDDGSGFVQIQLLAANANSFTDTGLSDSVQYSYRVRATNAVGDSAFSNTASATAAVTVTPPPSSGSGGGGSGGSGGCSTGPGSAWWLLWLLPMVWLRVARREA